MGVDKAEGATKGALSLLEDLSEKAKKQIW